MKINESFVCIEFGIMTHQPAHESSCYALHPSEINSVFSHRGNLVDHTEIKVI